MYIPILVLFGISLISYKKIKIDTDVKKISFMYLLITEILLFLSSLNPLKLYNVSNYTYLMIILSVIAFVVPFLLISKKIIKVKVNFQNIKLTLEKSIDNFIKNKVLLFAIIINLILVIFYKIKYNIIIQELQKQEIRLARFNDLFSGAFEALFFNYIISGTIYILSALFVILLVNKKVKNPIFLLSGANIIIYSLIGYGRLVYFNIIIYIFVNILLFNNIIEYFNYKSIIKIFFIIFILFIILTTMLYFRIENKKHSLIQNIKIAVKNQLENGIEYVIGGFRLLDNYIINGFDEFNDYTLGQATFAGVEEIINYPLKAIGLEINSFNNVITKYTQKPMLIGENNSYFNAYYTSIMNFYMDFGIAGVIIFPVLHSILIIYCLKNYYINKNIYSLLLLNYVLLNLFFSIIRWNYQSGTSVFVLFILIILNIFNRKEENIENIMDSK